MFSFFFFSFFFFFVGDSRCSARAALISFFFSWADEGSGCWVTSSSIETNATLLLTFCCCCGRYKIALRGSVGEAQRLRAVEIDRSQDPQVRACTALEKQRAKNKTVAFAGPRQRSGFGMDLGHASSDRHETDDNIVAVLSGDGQHVLHFYDSRTGETVENLDSEIAEIAAAGGGERQEPSEQKDQSSSSLASTTTTTALASSGATRPFEQEELSNLNNDNKAAAATRKAVPHEFAREKSHHKLGGGDGDVDDDEDHHDRHLWEAMHKRSFVMHPPLPPDTSMSEDGNQATWTTLHDPNRRNGAYFVS